MLNSKHPLVDRPETAGDQQTEDRRANFEVCMRRSESSEIAGRDHPLRPAMLHEELLREPGLTSLAVMSLALQPCYADMLLELSNVPLAGKTEA